MTSKRTLLLATLAAVGLISAGSVYATPPLSTAPAERVSPYRLVATLPDVIDGQPLRDLAFDNATRRLYAGSDRGLFWSDLSDAKPVFKGPLFKKDIRRIEMAPDLGRVFFTTETEIGYVDVRNASTEPVTLAVGRAWATELVYEPRKQQVYVATGTSLMVVFDARSGERAPDINLPGWSATRLKAIPGRVFMNVSGKDGIYQIDAETHAVSVWPIEGRVVTPAYFEADPSGRHVFAVYHQFIVALDVATAKEIGRLTTPSKPSMAFDPGTGWLLVSWVDERSRVQLKAYQVDARGFTEVGAMNNPALGESGLEPASNGFIQDGYLSLLVWATK